MLNVVVLMGRLVADPQMRQTPRGDNVVTIRIAVDRNRKDATGQYPTDFIDVTAWRQSAEFISRYFTKGSLIVVEGSLQSRTYVDKNGNNRTAYEVLASNVSFAPRNQGNQGGQTGQGGYAPRPQADAAPQEYARPTQEPPMNYSSGSNDDFAVIDDSEDLPF